MKNLACIIIFFALLCFACSSDDTTTPIDPEPVLTQFIYENYNTINEPNTVTIRKTYTIENNRIISTTHETIETGYTSNRTYTYVNNKISEISRFIEGLLIEKKNFTYDTDGNLTEYLRETTANSNSQAVYIKQNFSHTQDTIFGTNSQSLDGINYDVNSNSKIVLDSNLNMTFSENYDVLNNETTRSEHIYDANNNVVSSSGFLELENGNFVNTISSTYTYESGINTLGLIYEATFGRQVLMLSAQHQDNSSALNNYNSKYLSNYTFSTFTSTFFGNGNFTPEFSHTYNDDNYSTFSDYRLLVNNDLFTRFTYEYIFE